MRLFGTKAAKSKKKISRRELLEMLIDQEKEIKRLNGIIGEQEEELNDRRLRIENAGSFAEACLSLNRVGESVDAAAKQYVFLACPCWHILLSPTIGTKSTPQR